MCERFATAPAHDLPFALAHREIGLVPSVVVGVELGVGECAGAIAEIRQTRARGRACEGCGGGHEPECPQKEGEAREVGQGWTPGCVCLIGKGAGVSVCAAHVSGDSPAAHTVASTAHPTRPGCDGGVTAERDADAATRRARATIRAPQTLVLYARAAGDVDVLPDGAPIAHSGRRLG